MYITVIQFQSRKSVKWSLKATKISLVDPSPDTTDVTGLATPVFTVKHSYIKFSDRKWKRAKQPITEGTSCNCGSQSALDHSEAPVDSGLLVEQFVRAESK